MCLDLNLHTYPPQANSVLTYGDLQASLTKESQYLVVFIVEKLKLLGGRHHALTGT